MTGFELGEAVVHGMGCDGAAARSPQATHHSCGEAAGFGNSDPSLG